MTRTLLGILALIIAVTIVANFLVWPNSYLGQTDISFWTRSQVRKHVKETLAKPIKIKLEGKEFEKTYSDLDINLSTSETLAPIERIGFGWRLQKWIFAPTEITLVQPVMVFGSSFEDLVRDMVDPVKIEEWSGFDKDKLSFAYFSNSRAKKIDVEDFRRQLIISFGQTERVLEPTLLNLESNLEKRVREGNVLIDRVINKPVEIIIEEESKKAIVSLQRGDFSGLLDTKGDLTLPIDLKVDKNKLANILSNKAGVVVPAAYAASQIEKELLARQSSNLNSPVILGDDVGPNSDGTAAGKYIEVDISQQKMFLFENGNLIKSFRVSTGLYYPTPTGKYKILNKSTLGYSSIFDVFMPYWMAFYYAKDLEAYLGIHELPYKLGGGQKVYRFGNYIGQKKTGGCVALAPGSSREVYDFSFPNMDVLIYN